MKRFGICAVAMVLLVAPCGLPPQADETHAMILYDRAGLTVQAHLQLGLNGVAERNLFWDYASTVAPAANFDPDQQWLEGYVKPGSNFTKSLGNDLSAYGRISVIGSATYGTDAFDSGNTGRITLEEGYLGLQSEPAAGSSLDISIGPRELKAGTGMLIANGGSSGFERGTLKLGPRKAWKEAVRARVGYNGLTGTAFYIEPNETRAARSDTKIVGADFRYDEPSNRFAE